MPTREAWLQVYKRATKAQKRFDFLYDTIWSKVYECVEDHVEEPDCLCEYHSVLTHDEDVDLAELGLDDDEMEDWQSDMDDDLDSIKTSASTMDDQLTSAIQALQTLPDRDWETS